jgi:hypothetical protein
LVTRYGIPQKKYGRKQEEETKESVGSGGSTLEDDGSNNHREREKDQGRIVHDAKERSKKCDVAPDTTNIRA